MAHEKLIPDQVNASLSTVNVAAVALNSGGEPTGTRASRRIVLDNSGLSIGGTTGTIATTGTTGTQRTAPGSASQTYSETPGGVHN